MSLLPLIEEPRTIYSVPVFLCCVEIIFILASRGHSNIFGSTMIVLNLVFSVTNIELICVYLIFILHLLLYYGLLLDYVWILIEGAFGTCLLITCAVLVLRLILLRDFELLILYFILWLVAVLLFILYLLGRASTFQIASLLVLDLLSLCSDLIHQYVLVYDCFSWQLRLWTIFGLQFLLHKFSFVLSNVWLVAPISYLIGNLLCLYQV